jgi:branched-chain amino acid transport system permease protein
MIIQILISGILLGGVYILASIGLTLIFGVAKVVNFAHGEILMLGMYLTFWLYSIFNMDPSFSIAIVIPIFFLLGTLMYLFVIRPSLNAPELTQVFATLGLSILLQNLALLLWGADYRTVKTFYSDTALTISPEISISVSRVVAFVTSLLILLVLIIFLKKTYIGKAIQAVSQDRSAAMLMGINVKKIYMYAVGIGCACAGLAGALLIPQYYAFPTVGVSFILISFVVVVLGGIGSIPGAIVGGIIVGLLESITGVFVPELKEASYFIFFIIILLIRPNGLFGVKGAEEEGAR